MWASTPGVSRNITAWRTPYFVAAAATRSTIAAATPLSMPATNPAKSDVSQPLVDVGVGVGLDRRAVRERAGEPELRAQVGREDDARALASAIADL